MDLSGLRPEPPGFKSASTTQALVEGGGFEPPKLARQIYSLIPLATREPLLARIVNDPKDPRKNGAGGRNRTPDLRITSALLYRLSYTSSTPRFERPLY